MSEFSSSYHLKSSKQEDGVSLLRRAHLSGYVFEAVRDWVTVLPEDRDGFQLNNLLLRANQGTLLYYWSSDEEWGFAACWNDHVVSRYRCIWENVIKVDDTGFEGEAMQDWLSRIGLAPALKNSLIKILDPVRSDECSEYPSRRFARWVGLENFEWISYEYIANDYDDNRTELRGVIAVYDGNATAETSAVPAISSAEMPALHAQSALFPLMLYGDAATTRKQWKTIVSQGWKAGEWGNILNKLEMKSIDLLPAALVLSVTHGLPPARDKLWRVYWVNELLKDCALHEMKFSKSEILNRLSSLILDGMEHFWFTFGLLQSGNGGLGLNWSQNIGEAREFDLKCFRRFVYWLPEIESAIPRIYDPTGTGAFQSYLSAWASNIIGVAGSLAHRVDIEEMRTRFNGKLSSAMLAKGIIERDGDRFQVIESR